MKARVLAVLALFVCVCSGCRKAQDGSPVRERVELITYRTRKPHDGCTSNGFWQATGNLRKVDAYGIDKPIWMHKCDGCGESREFWDEQWPKFEREWKVVK